MDAKDIRNLSEAYLSVYQELDEASPSNPKLYTGRHGQTPPEYMNTRSRTGKQISGTSTLSGAAFSHRSFRGVGIPAEPGQRQQHQARMTPADRNELAIGKANLRAGRVDKVGGPKGLPEDVEIATEYFYEMGFNEYGIDILIEELGVEEFVDWVDEIVEGYTLVERKLQSGETGLSARSRERIGGRSVSRTFSDPTKKTTAGGKRRAARAKAAAQTSEPTERQQRLQQLQASQRERNATKAISKQPETKSTPTQTRQGIAGRLGAALGSAVRRHQTAVSDFKKKVEPTVQTVTKAATVAGEGGRRFAQAAYTAGQHLGQTPAGKSAKKHGGQLLQRTGEALKKRAVQDTERVRNWLTREEYDYILSHLLDEGYANDLHGAEVILMNMSEDWALEVLDEANKAVMEPIQINPITAIQS